MSQSSSSTSPRRPRELEGRILTPNGDLSDVVAASPAASCGSILRPDSQGPAMRLRSFLLTCALTCRLFQPGAASAQNSSPLPWENIFSRDYGVLEAALSPDGRWVAVTANTTEGL